jgi:hypothetical protein
MIETSPTGARPYPCKLCHCDSESQEHLLRVCIKGPRLTEQNIRDAFSGIDENSLKAVAEAQKSRARAVAAALGAL